MTIRALLVAMALAFLATACSEEAGLPPLEDDPPPFAFSQYLENGDGKVIPRADVLLVRRPKHLEHVYALSAPENHNKPEQALAKRLFDDIEKQFRDAGVYVAYHVVSLRCAVAELPDCVPRWSFIEELLGPGDGPGARRLRQLLADSFEQTARQQGLENNLVLAIVNLLLTRGMMKSALSPAPRQPVMRSATAASTPAQAAAAPAPGPLAPSPGLVQALTGKNPTPSVAPGPRLLRDATVNPDVPQELRTTRPISSSSSQNAQLQADIKYLRNLGATNIRVNQQQLSLDSRQRVGINRPDLQFNYDGRRYHVEYDTHTSGRGPAHQSRAASNDPYAEIILLIVP